MSFDLSMKVVRAGQTDNGKSLVVGDAVEYRGHVIGGMVRIQLGDGSEAIAHPACFDMTSDDSGVRVTRGGEA